MSEDVEVRDNPGEGQFEVWVDGVRAGLSAYLDHAGVRTFPHTEVDDAYAGRGLSKRLIGEALDATRAAGLRVRPLCPAVAAYVRKNPGYADLVVS